uniref:Protein kinase domain-containing protein n=1 Tax=Kalanchoe fedtschenkoi TaxID=63787 RepID=A0A7N0VFM9_KALFE
MGCVSSKKQAVAVTPAVDSSSRFSSRRRSVLLGEVKEVEEVKREKVAVVSELGSELGESGRGSCTSEPVSFRLGNLHKYAEAEQVAAGWPAWLTAVAGEAIRGWVPLRPDAFEKLEKIGQGTYSSVFRARDLGTGKIVALKKVRFDHFEKESVRFMAREILILRRLDHPNVIKLEGIITSQMSCNIYLVFEYMEHDLSGLVDCPEIKFTEAQVKCYMKQLLSGLEHCHIRGVMHRDIKGSNLLVNNEGVLKIADFGLASMSSAGSVRPRTSRVVTLWYRPPELLLGSTDYGASVDMWSVGCVFAEILVGKPILQGRTEVEQLHKIFKLCGSPPDEFWKKSKLPHATLYKPQQPYESYLRKTFKDLPNAAVNLIEILLYVEPYKRGTASSALSSEYFMTKPLACEPSSLPQYPPNKEIDAKHREDAKRLKNNRRNHPFSTNSKLARKPNGSNKLAPVEDIATRVNNKQSEYLSNYTERDPMYRREPLQQSVIQEEASHVKNASQGDAPFCGPLQVSTSSNFAWAKRRTDDSSSLSHRRSSSRGLTAFVNPSSLASENERDSNIQENEVCNENQDQVHGRRPDSSALVNHAVRPQWKQFGRYDSFDGSDDYHSHDWRHEQITKKNNLDYDDQDDKVDFSGPLLSQSHKIDELLQRHERKIRQAVRKSWFQKGNKIGY